jgi:hypothetical protein
MPSRPPGLPALREAAPPRMLRDVLLALAGVLALEALFFHPLLPKLRTHILVDDVLGRPGLRDAYQGLWVYWWMLKRLVLGADPFFCDWVMPPIGASLHFDSQRLLPTLLTLPPARMFGAVAGYNLMVLLLVALGALAFFLFVYRTFELSWPAAFLGAVGFGLCPYFVLKATCHANLIGAGFWGGALGALLHAYARNKFPLKVGLLLSACAWATFWNSSVEFFMLGVISLLVVLVFEIRRFAGVPAPRWRKAAFFALLLPGIPSLLFLKMSPWSSNAVIPLYDGVGLADLFAFPRLSCLSFLRHAEIPEFRGVYLPVSCLALAAAGFARLRGLKDGRGLAWGLALLALLGVALTVNAMGIPSALLELLPRGKAFRVMSRFFPMLMFFAALLASFGLDALRRRRGGALKWVLAGGLAALALVEYFPILLQVGAVRAFPMTAAQRSAMDDGLPVLVYPKGGYTQVDDTYQMALDRPAVFAWYLALGGRHPYKYLVKRAPRVYYNWAQPWDGQWDPLRQLELSRLGVGYLLLGDRARLRELPPELRGRVVVDGDSGVVVRLPRVNEAELIRALEAAGGPPPALMPPGLRYP